MMLGSKSRGEDGRLKRLFLLDCFFNCGLN